MKPIIIAPYYRDAVVFAAARLGLQPRSVTVVLRLRDLTGRDLAGQRVYFLDGRWENWRLRGDLIDHVALRGGEVQRRTLPGLGAP